MNESKVDIAKLKWRRTQGFTLIELLIVAATIAVILTVAHPMYSSYSISSNIAEIVDDASTVSASVAAACLEGSAKTFPDSSSETLDAANKVILSDFVKDIQIAGSCLAPRITIETLNTGQLPNPLIVLTGRQMDEAGRLAWECSSPDTPPWLLPKSCDG